MRLANYDLKLVLGGGAALGAYQAGAFQAIEEAGLLPSHLSGTSIGAVNAALIAGNPPGRRLERLRRFWELVAEPVDGGLMAGALTRRVHDMMAALRARLLGRPGLYAPQLLPSMSSPGLYSFGPALATLPELADLGLPSHGGPRLTVNVTDLVTGEPVRFDSQEQPITPSQVMASASLIPDFPPMEIDGRHLCDGGFTANLPVRPVLDLPPQRSTLCIAVDLLPSEGVPTWSLDGMIERKQDLHFAGQTRAALAGLAAEVALAAARVGRPTPPVLLAHLVHRGKEGAGSQKLYDYSRRSISERWERGHAEASAMLAALSAADDPTGSCLTIQHHPEPGPVVEPLRAAA